MPHSVASDLYYTAGVPKVHLDRSILNLRGVRLHFVRLQTFLCIKQTMVTLIRLHSAVAGLGLYCLQLSQNAFEQTGF